MTSLLVTIDSVKIVLRKARKSTPFCNVIEYCMIQWLRDEEVQWPAKFLRSVSTRVPLRAFVHGDFYTLPAKVPHGPIVNARHLLNFTTMRKLVRAHIAASTCPSWLGPECCHAPSSRCMLLPAWRICFVCCMTIFDSISFAENVCVW